MKILFLDMDGVLNTPLVFQRIDDRVKVWPDEYVEADQIARLNRIVAATGCKGVLSSSWRHAFKLDEMNAFFGRVGITLELIDTVQNARTRGTEILNWLKAHPEVTRYCALDDMLMEELLSMQVHTRGWRGLVDEDVEVVISILNH